MESRILLLFVVVALLNVPAAVSGNRPHARPPVFDHGVDLPRSRPLNIAHRGSAGVLPENTLEAFADSIKNGADALECDLCLTKDLKLVVIHESWLSDLTDVASKFPEERINTYFVPEQGRQITDYFTVDFTLEELRALRVRQRRPDMDPSFDYQFGVPEFREYIELIQSSERPVAVYAELKDPLFANSLDIIQEAGTTIEDLLLDELEAYGYTESTDRCFVQSFNINSVRYMSSRSNLPMNVLLTVPFLPNNASLEDFATFAYGVSVNRRLIVQAEGNGRAGYTDLVARAHAHGLRVHVWTLRNENKQLLWDYEQDPYLEYADFLALEADGIITDFPGSYNRFLDVAYADCQ